jgi:hypothetical protein
MMSLIDLILVERNAADLFRPVTISSWPPR